MKIPFVDLKQQYQNIKNEIDNAINNVIGETAFIGGKYVNEFEENYAKKYGVKHFISVANGTDAIFIVLKMLGIGPGDEVITVANSWISTSEVIGLTGATPVFVDIEPDLFTINPEKIEEKITSKTKAIIPVHLYGQPANIKKIKEIADKYNLFLVEDCAQAHFAEFENKKVGTWGIAGTFSFYPGKNLGAYGDAGGIITNDDTLARKMRMFARHGALVKHQHEMEGINSRLDALQAAILNVKLKYILQWNDLRFKQAIYYNKLLEEVHRVKTPAIRNNAKHIFHLYVIRTDKRDELKQFLAENGIQTAIHYPTPLPLLNAYKHLNYSPEDIPIAYEYSKQILSLPMFPELTDEQVEYVVEKIRQFFKNEV